MSQQQQNLLPTLQDKESTPRGTHLQTTDNRHSIPTPSIGYRIRTIHAYISTNTFINGSANPQQITNRPIKKAKVIRTTNSNQMLSPRALVIVRATTALQIAYHEQHPRPFEVNVVQSLSITNWHARVWEMEREAGQVGREVQRVKVEDGPSASLRWWVVNQTLLPWPFAHVLYVGMQVLLHKTVDLRIPDLPLVRVQKKLFGRELVEGFSTASPCDFLHGLACSKPIEFDRTIGM